MSTSPNNQDALFYTAKPPAPREPRAGEFQWAIRKQNLTVLRCELRDHGPDVGVEVQVLRDGEFLFGRRFPDRAGAIEESVRLLADHVGRGDAVLSG